MYHIERFHLSKKKAWDDFITASKNGTFIHYRDYMDYHADRFSDYSLIVYNKNQQIIALLPANKTTNTLYSHQGLTYGGFITDISMSQTTMLDVFLATLDFLQDQGISEFYYKTVPYIYHKHPANEDLYALFLLQAKLYRRDSLTTLKRITPPLLQERRRRALKGAQKLALDVRKEICFKSYWQLLEENLATKYNATPVHSIDEIELLTGRFPRAIKLFCCYDQNELLAGVVIYETDEVAHCQYIAASSAGKEKNALDLVFHHLINNIFSHKTYIDFGISNEDNGQYLNRGLIQFKEGFGGRTINHDFYHIDINKDALWHFKERFLK